MDLWHELKSGDVVDINQLPDDYVYYSSPIFSGDSFYISSTTTNAAAIVGKGLVHSVGINNNKENWRIPTTDMMFISPYVFDDLVVFIKKQYLIAVRKNTGNELWNYKFKKDRHEEDEMSKMINNENTILEIKKTANILLIEISTGIYSDPEIHALNLLTGELVWKKTDLNMFSSTMDVLNNEIIVASNSGYFIFLDPKAGTETNKIPIPDWSKYSEHAFR